MQLRRRRRRRTAATRLLLYGTSVCAGLLALYAILLHSLLGVGEPNEPASVADPPANGRLSPLRVVDRSLYTVRINTWERPDQLIVSVKHHSQCPGAMQIQVVWCDAQDGEPPEEITKNPKVVIERHSANSLNERFNVLLPTPTLGILSIDDDVMRPCEAIDSGFFKWTQNPHRMVGFDARLHVEAPDSWEYGYLSTTEKANRYSLSLTRYCFIHRDYLSWYMDTLPKPIFDMVEKSFNCEDIAMSLFVSSLTDGRPPLLADHWAIKAMIKLYSASKISGTKDHKHIRDVCMDSFAGLLGLKDGSNRLRTATILHGKFRFFECGAPAETAKPEDIKVPRHKALVDKVNRWKTADFEIFRIGVASIRNDISGLAYSRGLIQDSGPWKKRFRNNKHK